MNYLTFEHKKELRFGSRISLRSNFVHYAIDKNQGIQVFHKGKRMTLDIDDLKSKGFHNKNSTHIAKYKGYGIQIGEKYYLIDFTFIPDEERQKKDNPSQMKLINNNG